MEIINRISPDRKISIVQLNGRFDAYEEIPVREQLNYAIKTTKGHVVVNLKGVNFLDSAALSILVKGLKHCREYQGDLYLCELQHGVRVLFQLTRLDQAFRIFVTEEEAQATLRM